MSRVYTKRYPAIFNKEESKEMYAYLEKTCEWGEGIKTRHGGHTRKACPYDGDDDKINEWIGRAMSMVKMPDSEYLGSYINYYENGNDYTPSHSHKKQCQMIISLGATRDLVVGKKTYTLNSGDVIVFDSSIHSVPKDKEVKEGRISIATFSLILPS